MNPSCWIRLKKARSFFSEFRSIVFFVYMVMLCSESYMIFYKTTLLHSYFSIISVNFRTYQESSDEKACNMVSSC